jgi:hypothetical protein
MLDAEFFLLVSSRVEGTSMAARVAALDINFIRLLLNSYYRKDFYSINY